MPWAAIEMVSFFVSLLLLVKVGKLSEVIG